MIEVNCIELKNESVEIIDNLFQNALSDMDIVLNGNVQNKVNEFVREIADFITSNYEKKFPDEKFGPFEVPFSIVCAFMFLVTSLKELSDFFNKEYSPQKISVLDIIFTIFLRTCPDMLNDIKQKLSITDLSKKVSSNSEIN